MDFLSDYSEILIYMILLDRFLHFLFYQAEMSCFTYFLVTKSENYLQAFLHLFDVSADPLHYPLLIHLFYTNLQIDHETGFLSSLVRDVEIEFDSKLLGQILDIPPSETLFNTIELNDERIFEQILLPDAPHCPPFKNINLQTRARIAGRILAHNVLPKTGSFDYYSTDLSTALYVLFGNISGKLGQRVFYYFVETKTFSSVWMSSYSYFQIFQSTPNQ